MAYGVSGPTETHVSTYDQGTLIVDIVIPKSDSLVWRGVARGRIPEKMTAEERDKTVGEVVTQVMADFPPKRVTE